MLCQCREVSETQGGKRTTAVPVHRSPILLSRNRPPTSTVFLSSCRVSLSPFSTQLNHPV